MKLRTKLNGEKLYFDVPNSCSLAELEECMGQLTGLQGLELSLNGFSRLTNESASVTSLGIVAGDLIHILNHDHFTAATRHGEGVSSHLYKASIAGAKKTKDNIEHKQGPSTVSPSSTQASVAPTRQIRTAALFVEEGITYQLRCLFQIATSTDDALFAAVHAIAMETGLKEQASFPSLSTANATQEAFTSLGKCAKGFYQLTYFHPLCNSVSCSASGSIVGKYLMLSGAVNLDDATPHQCSLKVADFVVRSSSQLADHPNGIYRNLKGLSQVVKQSFFNPLLGEMKTAAGVAGGLVSLPMDVMFPLLMTLDAVSLTKLASTCKFMRECADDPVLWRKLCLVDFHAASQNVSNSVNWKKHYRQCVMERKCAGRITDRNPELYFDPPWIDNDVGRANHFPGGIHPQFPGMIGGYHDLHPTLPYMPGGLQPNSGRGFARQPPRARFDPFGPLPDNHIIPRRPRGTRPHRDQPRFL